MLLLDALPDLAVELIRGFRLLDRPDLADQVRQLEAVARCRCEEPSCATSYTQMDEPWKDELVERLIPDVPGLLCVQVVEGVIARLELLNRPRIRERLRELFPNHGG